jgi:hypothetical protein
MFISKSNIIIKNYFFSKNLNLYLIPEKSLFLLKSNFGVISLKLPSYYFFIQDLNLISLLFIKRFFFLSFIKHFFYLYNRLYLLYFIRIKIRGLGYRIRKVTNDLYYFFFNYTNMFYFYLPKNVLIKWYKKRIILLSYDFFILKTLFSHILLLKALGPYRRRGLRFPRQILLLKKKVKAFR